MLDTKACSAALAAWFVVTFVLCVGWCSVAPEGWHVRPLLELLLPGFTWLSAGSFVLGAVESALFGAYAGVLFALLYNGLQSGAARDLAKRAATPIS